MCNCNFSNADGFIDNETPSMSDNGLLDLPFDGQYSADGLDFGSPYGDFEDDVEDKIGRMSHSNRFDGMYDGLIEGSARFDGMYDGLIQGTARFDGEAEFGDGEFDDFLTRRSRARRKLRKKLRKEGKSRKEARKEAIKSIPKQKLGAIIKQVAKGGFSPSSETNQILKDLENKGVIDKSKDGLDKVAEQLTEAVNENVAEGTQNEGSTGGTTDMPMTPPAQAGGGKPKTMLFVGIGAVVLIGGYFLFFRK
tara:strand:+ start:3309 stop:4061 length:753 start_codon:yes stop_codon:yes gene_type:complete